MSNSPYSHIFEPPRTRDVFNFKGNKWLRYASLAASLISVSIVICGVWVTKAGLSDNSASMIVLGIVISIVGIIIFAVSSPVWIIVCCNIGGPTQRTPERRLSFISELYELRQAEDGFANDSLAENAEALQPRPPSYQASEESLHPRNDDDREAVPPADNEEQRARFPSDPPPPYSE